MDTTVIAVRLKRLDDYVGHLRALQAAPLDEYLAEELSDFDQFAQEIISLLFDQDEATTDA
jgi:hypothetical protein